MNLFCGIKGKYANIVCKYVYEYAASVSSIVPSVSLFVEKQMWCTPGRENIFFVFILIIIKDLWENRWVC